MPLIHIFTTGRHRYAAKPLAVRAVLRNRLKVRSYDWLFRRSRLTTSTVIFTDFERLLYHENLEAARIAGALKEAGVRIFNPPAEVRQRHDLLFHLHKEGINPFQAYRAFCDPEPSRFPVFLKSESEHRKVLDKLHHDQTELDAALAELRQSGVPLQNILVIEYANTPVRDGVWERHTAYRVGDRLIAAPQVGEDRPFVKYGTLNLATEAEFQQGVDIVAGNRHPPELARVFEIANIQYGRADYGFENGRLAVYEINTNPTIPTHPKSRHAGFARAHRQVLDKLDEAFSVLDGPSRTVRIPHRLPWFLRLDLRYVPRLRRT